MYGYKTYGSKNVTRGHLGSQGSLTTWKIWKQLQFIIKLCHLVDNNQSFKKVNGDLVIKPHLKGSKVKMCHFFKTFKMLLLIQIVWSRDSCKGSASILCTKVMGLKIQNTGSKAFSQSAYFFHMLDRIFAKLDQLA